MRGLVWALGLAMLATSSGPAQVDSRDRRILVMLHLAAPHLRARADYGGAYGDDVSRGGRRRTAQRIAARHGLALVDNWPMPLIEVDCFIMTVPDGRSSNAAAREVESEAGVEWSQPVQSFSGLADRGNPLFAAQPAAGRWHLADLHHVATGRGVTIAVIDSKVDVGHPDLVGRFAVAADFTTGRAGALESHGTGVAGILAANAGDGIGIAGVAPAARLLRSGPAGRIPPRRRPAPHAATA